MSIKSIFHSIDVLICALLLSTYSLTTLAYSSEHSCPESTFLDTTMPCTEIINLAIGDIHIIDQGEGPVIFLLHAGPGDIRDYKAVIPSLSQHYRVIAVAWPGYGVSPAVGLPEENNVLTIYNSFVQLFDELEISQATIIGNSIGGYVAARYAIEYPDKVRNLVLVSSAGFTPRNFITNLLSTIQGSQWSLTPAFFASIYIRNKTPLASEVIARAETIHSTKKVKATTRAVWRSITLPEVDLSKSAMSITQPTLLIYGKKDIIISNRLDGKVARKSMAHATKVILNTGHVSFAEAPDAFLEVVLPFLEN